MPTKRTSRLRHRREPVPAWVDDLLTARREPLKGSEAWDEYVGWMFFDRSVPGLPDEGTDEGRSLVAELHRAD